MEFYSYDAIDGLSRLESDPLTVEQEEHQPWDKYLQTNGYCGFLDSIGDEHLGWSVGVRYADDKASIKPKYPYVVELGNCHQGQLIFCFDFLSAAEAMRLYAPLVLAQIITTASDSLAARLDDEWKHTEQVREARWRQVKASRVIASS